MIVARSNLAYDKKNKVARTSLDRILHYAYSGYSRGRTTRDDDSNY